MSQEARVLFANDAFYAAFAGRDPDAMDAVWSEREPVLCVHPGWPPLDGRDEVLSSWRRILSGPSPPKIRCVGPSARLLTDELAVVLCFEVLEQGTLAASNLFRLENGVWRMVHHHASPAQLPPGLEDEARRERSIQ